MSRIKFPKTRKEFDDKLMLAYIQGFLDCNNNKELVEIYIKQGGKYGNFKQRRN